MRTIFSRRLLHQYKVQNYDPCLRKLEHGGGGDPSGMEYENESLNILCLIKETESK